MTLVAKIDGVTLPDGALLIRGAPNSALPGGIQGLPTAAWYGEALSGGIQLDDPEGDLDTILTLDGLHTFTVDETACTGKERIWSGWLTASGISRGPYKDGPGRIWDVDIIELNWLLALVVFRAESANRPAETDLARVAFALASGPMSFTPAHDNGRFNVTDNPRSMDEGNYVTKFPIELFATTALSIGKNVYIYYDHTEAEASIHYDLIGVGPTSTLAISNVIADKDSTTHYPFLDADLKRDPAWRVTEVLFGFRGSYAYGFRQATIDDLSPTEFSPVAFHRSEVYTSDRVGRLSTANALIETMLEERAGDIHTINVSIRVPAAQVNLIEAGDLIDVKFTHLPGYEEPVTMPVIRRNVLPTAGRTDMYDIHLELRAAAKASGPGGGDPGELPHEPQECAASVIQAASGTALGINVSATFSEAPTPGNVVWCGITLRGTGAIITPTGFTQIETQGFDDDGQSHATYYREVQPGDSATVLSGPGNPSSSLRMAIAELSGVNVVLGDSALLEDDADHGPDWTQALGDLTVTTGGIIVSQAIIGNNATDDTLVSDANGATTLYNAGSNGGGPARWVGYKVVTADGTEALSIDWDDPGSDTAAHGQSAISAFFACSGEDFLCPNTGTWVEEETVTLTGADGVTRCPFADLSLHVFIDNVEQTAKLVSQDGATGAFTLGFDPTPTEVCTVSYQGR